MGLWLFNVCGSAAVENLHITTPKQLQPLIHQETGNLQFVTGNRPSGEGLQRIPR